MEIAYFEDDQYHEANFQTLQETQNQFSFLNINKNNLNQFDNAQKQKLAHLRRKKASLNLKQIITKAKVDILKKNFVRKIKRGTVYSKIPHDLAVEQKSQGATILARILLYLQNKEGIQLSPIMLCMWSFINIIQVTMMIIIYSIMIAFPETQDLGYFVTARIISVIIYFFDMILNFITQRYQTGGHKKTLKSIMIFYITNQFTPDFFSIAFFPLSYAFKASTITPIILFIALFKLMNNLKRFEHFQYIYVKTNTRQEYYSLIKVFLLNFSIGHFLSILLNLMATLSQNDQNWYSKLNIENDEWYNKYIWGYYWGTNIMLTVGFGDLSATNVTEAGILIFIETISCITLAYNISCVGSIIKQIKSQNQEKKKKLKYFHRMCEENNISEDLQQKINNFIEESYLIKQEFQFEEYEEVINALPKSMQSEYRKQANKSLFDVGFFNSLNNKTILNLAEFVIRKVAHPEQIIQKRGQIENFCILQKGIIGFACKSVSKSILNGTIIDKFQIAKDENSKILSLGFMKRKILLYDVKSLCYSVYYYLTLEQLMKIMKSCEMDYQFFLYMKDRDENIMGSNEIFKCKICQDDFHSLFQCPKYHYIPMKQLLISNYLKKHTSQKLKRNPNGVQRRYRDFRTFYHMKSALNGQQRYFNQNFDEDQINQIKGIKKYYYYKQVLQQNFKFLNDASLNLQIDHRRDELQVQFEKMQEMLQKATCWNSQFWTVQSDSAMDFKYYFKEYNPNRLINFKMHVNRRKGNNLAFGNNSHKNFTTNVQDKLMSSSSKIPKNFGKVRH